MACGNLYLFTRVYNPNFNLQAGIHLKKIFILCVLFYTALFGSFKGYIIDKENSKPLQDVIISDSKHSVKSDKNGFFIIKSDEDIYHVKAYGYRPLEFNKNINWNVLEVEPIKIKALYLTFWAANATSPRAENIIEIAKQSEINAVVVDVKNEYGSTSYKTSFEQANSYGADEKRTNKDIKQFMALMKKNNIYTIARIVTFKDELQAINNPSYVIRKEDTGQIWRNSDNMAWVDPFDKRSHEYAVAIAEEAAKVGFDEINFDYIRFPAKTGLKLSKENTQENRVKAIEDFLDLAQERLRKYGVFISADTYGNICWSNDDTNIGQTVTSLAKHADYLAPMLYPSGFANGSFLFKYPSEHPHAVIYKSIKNIHDRINPSRIRPWLQCFKDYTYRKKSYDKFEIKEQIRASEETNTNGWMMWSPSSTYTLNYFQ